MEERPSGVSPALSLRPGCVQACPGCEHRGLSAPESAERKWETLRRALDRSLGRNHRQGLDFLSSEVKTDLELRWGYRKRSVLSARVESGAWRLGMLVAPKDQARAFVKRSDLELVEIPDCPVQSESVNRIARKIAATLPLDFPAVFVAVAGRLATIVLKARVAPSGLGAWLERLDPASLGLAGVWLNLNFAAGNRVFSASGWQLLWGAPRAQDELGLWYGPESFQQQIATVYRQALSEAQEFLEPGINAVVDGCSGVGASLQLWRVPALGVELSGDAVACAALNLGPGRVLRGRFSERLPQLSEWLRGRGSSGVFVNPPRLGLERKALDWILSQESVKKVAYLSCSPGTLARDLALLAHPGSQRFTIRRVQAYDFFPQTAQIEALALLER